MTHITTGTVTYIARISGLKLEEVELRSPNPKIEKITLKTQEQGTDHTSLEVTFTLKDVLATDNFRSIVKPILSPLIDRLGFYFNGVYVEEPQFSGSALPSNPQGNTFITEAVHIVALACTDGIIEPGSKGREKLKVHLESSTLPGEDQYKLFNFATRQKDPVARFMFLYNILLSLRKDKQTNVDIFIAQEELGVQQTPSPKTSKLETIYTRLRNEVSHVRKGAIPQNTKKDITENVGKLQELVKKAIIQQP
ncbi:MAG: hypothetical protein R3F37_03785 [Candidatus Competibacteraceae bacterium]